MHIKKLEIAGFKSFLDRTVLHFDHDIVGIVGPNGCGKSNIVDAIRWCMGEQSAKHLRGRAMEDVIFNGSESRNPQGVAEVSLTFDNTDAAFAATLPPEYRDYPEIVVTRRLFRDGTSEYLINRTVVRLRDVTDLFLGTGIGTKAYSIVEQGRIGQIVSARPEDRRLFIEEAAGITKYKQRCRLAERKLELTRQNLIRVSDIISEIDRSRSSLKRQVAKAERFLEYRAELDDLVLHESSHRLLELLVTGRAERSSLEMTNQRVASLRTNLKVAEERLQTARDHAAEIELRAEHASRAAFEADNEVSGLQAEMARATDRLVHFEERIVSARTEKAELETRLTGLRAELSSLTQRTEELGADERARENYALAEEQSLEQLRAEESRANREFQSLSDQAAQVAMSAAGGEARLDALGQRISELHGRRDRVASERDALVGELGALGAHQLVLSRTEAEAIEGKRLTLAEREQLESELEVLRARQLDSERRVDEAKNELGLKRNRLRALEELHRRLEGVGAGARALLSKHDPSVLGLVADRIEAPERCTSALAGLLAQWLECVVVSDLSKGLELLEQLKQSQRGRASILSQRPRYTSGGARGDWRTDPGVIGLLADELRYRDADEALVRALLGEAVLVESAADAVAFAERHPGATAVSLDGTVADPRGMVSGGGGDNAAFAILERQREMHSLSDEVSRLEASLAELLSTHNALRARRTELDTSLDRARQGVHEGELAHVTVQKDLARTSSEIQRLSARGEALELELGEIREGLSAAVEQQRASREELDELRSQLERARHDLAKVEAQAAGWRERVAGQATLVTERRVRLAQVKEQVEAARSATLRTGSSIAELGQRSQRLESEMHAAAEGFGQTAAQLIANREAIILAQATARDAHAALDQVKQVLEAARRDLSDGEAGLRQLREELELEEQDARKYEMTVQRLELERGHLLDSVRSRFRGLDLNRVVGDYHARPAPEEEHRRRIDELTQIIDRMGPVNLDARTEYRDTERRYQELSGQKTDIEQALADLERAIRHMNRESRKRFRDTFDAVNLQFKKSFARLFTGGRAELSLTDPEDLLGSGVDIVAQPPGKKLGTIELMSGGEKALTATALIFAILQHKPSPFCVLDEVDAPLDDANVARYNEVIREMTQHSQFILITHVQTTMRAVDVLWGVTMGEPGVSHLVSVKVNESAPARSDSRGPSVVHNAGENGKAKTQVA